MAAIVKWLVLVKYCVGVVRGKKVRDSTHEEILLVISIFFNTFFVYLMK